MAGLVLEASYLGGYPGHSVVRAPVGGRLVVDATEVRFDVDAEGVETILRLPWSAVTRWEVEGANVEATRSTGRRALVGALLAGVSGAVVGAATRKGEFQAVLVFEFEGSRVGFLVRKLSPIAVAGALRGIAGGAEA